MGASCQYVSTDGTDFYVLKSTITAAKIDAVTGNPTSLFGGTTIRAVRPLVSSGIGFFGSSSGIYKLDLKNNQ